MSRDDITWRDGERTITFGRGAVDHVPVALDQAGWGEYDLLSTSRALARAPVALREDARQVYEVPPGPVNEIAAELFDSVSAHSLVALGGGRVVDTAKAIAAVRGGQVAAIPTTLSGAEMTSIHKLPDGHEADELVRPVLVFADPDEMTTQDEPERRASAMNALAHAADCLYTPLAHPVSRLAALEGARLIAAGLDDSDRRRDLALGSLLAGYAIDSALFSLHHVICQSLVRVLRTPHAETNAAILPRVVEALIPRVPDDMTALAGALDTDCEGLVTRIEDLAGGRRALGEIGADREKLDNALNAIEGREELAMTPDKPDRDELRQIVESAW
ncbi:MAG: iron-containing alcohol dehydrogenase [Actinomycetota bacterium]|nr:iron-containing alcohol dehydrogenase [Actinomycetota bacterium]